MRRLGQFLRVERSTVERAARILGEQSSAAKALREADDYLRGGPNRSVAFLEDLGSSSLLVVKGEGAQA